MTTWHGDELDLDAYLERIGYAGNRAPTQATLAALHRAHTTSIPFENLEIILGRQIVLDLKALQHKMIRQRRGGYCFEHVALFAASLERLGFGFTALSGRVMLGAKTIRPRTHALLVVEFDDGGRWLCDVGFGRGPLEPIELIAGNEVDHDGWRLKLSTAPLGADTEVFHPEQWTLWQRSVVDGEIGWLDRHVFTLDPQYPIDFAVGNHFVSTSPRSPFVTRPFAQRFAAEIQHTLDGITWTTTTPDGASSEREVGIDDLPALLADTFEIELTAGDASALVDAMSG
ncbi:arylamine N-acetyltransferase family protein [Gordonia sp. CPCC 205333]|uniref:arylamine N-acetyltransferase family protein n=1 Tax=Gordonia sp. CPCC 205333 TaxID=3140790 RepID=UPI003AF407BA